MAALDDLRSAERSFLDTGDDRYLDRAARLAEGRLRGAPFATATRLWLSLLRYDRSGDDRHLDAAIDACRAGEWRDSGLAGVAVAVLLRRWTRDGDGDDLDRAIDLGRRPGAPREERDLPLWQTPAWRSVDLAGAYLERYRLRDSAADLRDARDILRGAVRHPEPVIRALGLRHLAACEQELYLRSGPRRLLDQAIRRYQCALAMISSRSVIRPMLLTELGTALQDRFAEDEDPADIDRAVAVAREAAAADAGRPDSACHLVNLGTALNTRYEQTGDPCDLDQALRHWSEALDALPPGSAYRPGFRDRLAVGLSSRWEHEGGPESDLAAAIAHGRAAAGEGAATPDAAVYAGHLADALRLRWELHRDPGDLHEAVRVSAAVADLHEPDGAQAADLAANLAHLLLARYQALGGVADVDAALTVLGRLPAAGAGRSQRATVAEATARALSMRYQVTGDLGDLAAAIGAARRGLAHVEARSVARNSRTARLASLLFLRYSSRGRRQDLDRAIELLHGLVSAADAGAGREPTPDQLSQLSGCLAERYDRDGDSTDQDAAIRFGRRARESDRRDGEPSVAANLASVLHTRFATEGWFGELHEAIDRHREAAERETPTAPVYPSILNNLALALESSYFYEQNDVALDEAIDLLRRAANCRPAGAPDRPGYLGNLAVVIRHRFERDHQVADLDQVIALDEQALAALASGAPDRSALLSNLAAARHLRARITGDQADFDYAADTFRAALRGTRASKRARAGVLLGYAAVLADRQARFPSGPGRSGRPGHAAMLRVFQDAVAASEGAPVLRLDAAAALGYWALRAGLWTQAAEACHTAALARRALFGVQVRRAHGDAWLARGADISVTEALAWVHCGDPRRAATALDGGRALGLSEALDARTLAGRLRAGNRPDLADRYERAARRLALATDPRAAGRPPGYVAAGFVDA